jgi:hypothetical protein
MALSTMIDPALLHLVREAALGLLREAAPEPSDHAVDAITPLMR